MLGPKHRARSTLEVADDASDIEPVEGSDSEACKELAPLDTTMFGFENDMARHPYDARFFHESGHRKRSGKRPLAVAARFGLAHLEAAEVGALGARQFADHMHRWLISQGSCRQRTVWHGASRYRPGLSRAGPCAPGGYLRRGPRRYRHRPHSTSTAVRFKPLVNAGNRLATSSWSEE